LNDSALPVSSDHPLQPFWDLAVAPVKTSALQYAIERDLFTRLAVPAGVDALAAELQLSPRHAALWLELLWGMGLLLRIEGEPQVYQRSVLAERWFTPASAENCMQAWSYRASFLGSIGTQLPQFIEHGRPSVPLPAASGGASTWAQAAQVQIGQEQRAVSVPLALALLQRHQLLHDGMRLLDLGGGPGWLAIAVAQQLPGSHTVVFDLPDTVAVAAQNIADSSVQSRASVMAGNLDEDDIGSGYDLVWCASVLHFLRDPAAAVKRMHAALRPGGTLAIAHAERSGEPDHDGRILPFYLPMQMRGSYLPAPGDVMQLLQQAGFSHIQKDVVHGFPMAPLTLYRGIA